MNATLASGSGSGTSVLEILVYQWKILLIPQGTKQPKENLQNRLQAEASEKQKVFGLGILASIDTTRFYSAKVARWHLHSQASGDFGRERSELDVQHRDQLHRGD